MIKPKCLDYIGVNSIRARLWVDPMSATGEVFGGGNIEFKSYSQLTFFNEKTDKIKRRAVIEMRNLEESHFDPGLTLEQLKRILREVYQLRVQMQYFSKAEESQINDFRDLVKNITKDKN